MKQTAVGLSYDEKDSVICHAPGHRLGTEVPRGGSSCANCSFGKSESDGPHCSNAGWIETPKGMGGGGGHSRLPVDDPSTYCCDLWDRATDMKKDLLKTGTRVQIEDPQTGETLSGPSVLRRPIERSRATSLMVSSLNMAKSAVATCAIGKSAAAGRAERAKRNTAMQDIKDHWRRALRAQDAADAYAELQHAALAAREAHGSDEFEQRAIEMVTGKPAACSIDEQAALSRELIKAVERAEPIDEWSAEEIDYSEIKNPMLEIEIEHQAGEQGRAYRVHSRNGVSEFVYWPGVGTAVFATENKARWRLTWNHDAPRPRTKKEYDDAILRLGSISADIQRSMP